MEANCLECDHTIDLDSESFAHVENKITRAKGYIHLGCLWKHIENKAVRILFRLYRG